MRERVSVRVSERERERGERVFERESVCERECVFARQIEGERESVCICG